MWSAQTLTQIALLDGHSTWLTSTIASLVVVSLLAACAWLFLFAGRRFHWLTNAEQIRLKRRLRVAFGALFLAAAILPYVLEKAPLLVVATGILAAVAVLPFLLTDPNAEAPNPELDH